MHNVSQRGLNDLWRLKLSCSRMIRLHARPHRQATHRKTEKERQLADGEGAGLEPNHTTARKLGPLYEYISQSSLM